MNPPATNYPAAFALSLELTVAGIGLVILLLDLWTPPERKRLLGYGAAAGLAFVFLLSFKFGSSPGSALGGSYVIDALALFFKRFFLLAGIVILILSADPAAQIEQAISEFYALLLFALTGMMFAASANDFILLFVSLELVTVCFYVLNSFQRDQPVSLEAGVKYLILGALSSAFLVYGIALVYGLSGSLRFSGLAEYAAHTPQPAFLLAILLVLSALSFKISAFPFQLWAPDVYQGSPTPATAFLAVGSKAAGFVLLLRVLAAIAPQTHPAWARLLMVVGAITILYGNLAAIPQRNLKRLLGYSSIANAGYLLLGVAAFTADGSSAVLYYLAGYLFTLLAVFAAIIAISGKKSDLDVFGLAGLNQRSPLLAAALTLGMVSLAGIPPMAGFFGKFLLLKSVLEVGGRSRGYYVLAAVALGGIVVSIYYYFGVIRAIYWSKDPPDLSPISVSLPLRVVLGVCIGGMLVLGLFPNLFLDWTDQAAANLRWGARPAQAIRSADSLVRKSPFEQSADKAVRAP